MHSRDVMKQLQKNGWYEVNQVGSHKQLKHPTKKGRVTVPHPKPGYTDRHPQKYRETGGDQTELIPGAKERSHGIYRLSS
jgi:hypothetical protein